MFEKTKSAISGVHRFFKTISLLIFICVQLMTIFYLVHAIKNDAGNTLVNGILCAVTVIYLIVCVIADLTRGKNAKRVKKSASRFRKIVKILLKLFTAFITVYSVTIAYDYMTVASLFFAGFTIIGCGFQLLFELIIILIEASISKKSKRSSDKEK